MLVQQRSYRPAEDLAEAEAAVEAPGVAEPEAGPQEGLEPAAVAQQQFAATLRLNPASSATRPTCEENPAAPSMSALPEARSPVQVPASTTRVAALFLEEVLAEAEVAEAEVVAPSVATVSSNRVKFATREILAGRRVASSQPDLPAGHYSVAATVEVLIRTRAARRNCAVETAPLIVRKFAMVGTFPERRVAILTTLPQERSRAGLTADHS